MSGVYHGWRAPQSRRGACGCDRYAESNRRIESLARQSLSVALAHAQQGRFEDEPWGAEAARPSKGSDNLFACIRVDWDEPIPLVDFLKNTRGLVPARYQNRCAWLYRFWRRDRLVKPIYIGFTSGTLASRVRKHIRGVHQSDFAKRLAKGQESARLSQELYQEP